MYNSPEKEEAYRFGLERLATVRREAGFAGLEDVRLLDVGGLGVSGRLFVAQGIAEKRLVFVEQAAARSRQLGNDFPAAALYQGRLSTFERFHAQGYGSEAGIEAFNWDLGLTLESCLPDLHGVLPVLKRGKGPRAMFAVMPDARRNRSLEDVPRTARRILKAFGKPLREPLEAVWADLWGRYHPAVGSEADPFRVALRELSAFALMAGSLRDVGLAVQEAHRWAYVSERGFRMRTFFFLLRDEADPFQALKATLEAYRGAPSWFLSRGQGAEHVHARLYPSPSVPAVPPYALAALVSLTRKECERMMKREAVPASPASVADRSHPTAAPAAVDLPREQAIAYLRDVLRHHDAETKRLFEIAIVLPPPPDPRAAILAACNRISQDMFGEPLSGVVLNEDGSVALRDADVPLVPVPAPDPPAVPPPATASAGRSQEVVQRPRLRKKVGHAYLTSQQRDELERNGVLRLRLVEAARQQRLPAEMLAILREEAVEAGTTPPEVLDLKGKGRQRLAGLVARGQGKHKIPGIVSYLHLATDRTDFRGRLLALSNAYGEPTEAILAQARTHRTWVEPSFPTS